ncbi:hypothetical protein D3C85_1130800 [compost metagenome]
MVSFGCCTANSASCGASTTVPKPSVAPMRTSPDKPSCDAGAVLSTAWKALSIASTCGCSRRPASVSRWPPASREKRGAPTSFSSAWMRRATVVWSTSSRRAALISVPERASSRK